MAMCLAAMHTACECCRVDGAARWFAEFFPPRGASLKTAAGVVREVNGSESTRVTYRSENAVADARVRGRRRRLRRKGPTHAATLYFGKVSHPKQCYHTDRGV